MRDLLLFAIIIASIPVMFKRPFVGILMWCWISYMNPHRLTWGFMTTFPAAYIIAVAFIMAYMMSKEPKTIPWAPPVVWLFIFLGWVFITFIVNEKSDFAINLGIKVLKIQLFTIFTLILMNSRKRIEQVLWVISYSIAFFGIKGGIFTILSGGDFRVYGPPGSYIVGNNELGLALLINIPLLFYLMTITSNKWLKRLNLLAILLCAASVLGTHSRGALLAAIACAIFLWLKSDKKLVMALVFSVIIPVGLSMMPDHWFERMNTIVQQKEENYDASTKGRFNAWRMAYNLASDQFFGAGFNATTRRNFILYAPDPNHYVDSHSIYFQVLGKHGFVGLFIYLMLWLSTWRLGSKIKSLAKGRADTEWAGKLAAMLQVSIVAFCTGGTFLGLAYFDLPYHILAVMVATYAVVNQQLKNLEKTPSMNTKPA